MSDSFNDSYYGVIYYKNGTKKELGACHGGNAELAAERMTAMQFDQELIFWERSGQPDFFKPSRYEVKRYNR